MAKTTTDELPEIDAEELYNDFVAVCKARGITLSDAEDQALGEVCEYIANNDSNWWIP